MSSEIGVKGFIAESELRDKLLRNNDIHNIGGTVNIGENIEDIICIDLDIDIIDVNRICFSDINLFDVHCRLDLEIFCVKESGETCLVNKKYIFTLCKKACWDRKEFNVFPVDGKIRYDKADQLQFSLVILLEGINI